MNKYRRLVAITLISLCSCSFALNHKTCMKYMPSIINSKWQTNICNHLAHIEAKHGHSRKQLTDTATSLATKIKQRIHSVANRKP